MGNLISSDGNIQQVDYFNLGHPQIVRNSAEHLFAGMINADRELEIHISTNAGVNWSKDTTLSYSNVTSFNLAITDRGDVLCAVNSQGADVALQMRNYNTGAWAEIRTDSTYTNRCIVRFDDLNNKICFYCFDGEPTFITNLHYSINYASSFVTQMAYTTGEKLNDAIVTEDGKHYLISTTNFFGQLYVTQLEANFTDEINRITLSVASNLYKFGTLLPVGNDCWVAYWHYQHSDTSYRLYTRIVHSDGSVTDKGVAKTWSAVNTPIEILSMLKDGDDNIYLLYSKQSDKNAYYVKYDNLAGTWGSETQITTANQGRFISSELNIPGDVSTANLTYFKTS